MSMLNFVCYSFINLCVYTFTSTPQLLMLIQKRSARDVDIRDFPRTNAWILGNS